MSHDQTMRLLPLAGPLIYLLLRKVRGGELGLPAWATPWVALVLGLAGGVVHGLARGEVWQDALVSAASGLLAGAVAVTMHEVGKTRGRAGDAGDAGSGAPPKASDGPTPKDVAARAITRLRYVGAGVLALLAVALVSSGLSCTAAQQQGAQTAVAATEGVCVPVVSALAPEDEPLCVLGAELADAIISYIASHAGQAPAVATAGAATKVPPEVFAALASKPAVMARKASKPPVCKPAAGTVAP